MECNVFDAKTVCIRYAYFGGNGYNTSQDTAVTNWIKKQQELQLHFSVCTGVLILAEAGILDGKTATTFHNALEESYPKIRVLRDVRDVDNGNTVSATWGWRSFSAASAFHCIINRKMSSRMSMAIRLPSNAMLPVEPQVSATLTSPAACFRVGNLMIVGYTGFYSPVSWFLIFSS